MSARIWSDDKSLGFMEAGVPTLIEIHGRADGNGGYVIVGMETVNLLDKIAVDTPEEVIEVLTAMLSIKPE
jgi:hypothetical protein